MRDGHSRYLEMWVHWLLEPIVAVVVVPVQVASWWLIRTWTHADLSDLLLIVVATWILFAPIYIVTRELIGKPTGPDGGYSNPHWITAEVIGRSVASTLAFLWVSSNSLAGLLTGFITGSIAAMGVVLFNAPWKPAPQPIRQEDHHEGDRDE
jgi:hypothetical protein